MVGGQATIIGPITLLPITPTTKIIPLQVHDIVLADQTSGIVFIAHPEGQHSWALRDLTHQTDTSVALPEAPTAIISSEDGSGLMVQTPSGSVIISGTGKTWSVKNSLSGQWSSVSNDVLFGIRNQRLVVLDSIKMEEQSLDAITSVVSGDSSLWPTVSQPQLGSTIIPERAPSTPSIAK